MKATINFEGKFILPIEIELEIIPRVGEYIELYDCELTNSIRNDREDGGIFEVISIFHVVSDKYKVSKIQINVK